MADLTPAKLAADNSKTYNTVPSMLSSVETASHTVLYGKPISCHVNTIYQE